MHSVCVFICVLLYRCVCWQCVADCALPDPEV